jgi:hypothetical protein
LITSLPLNAVQRRRTAAQGHHVLAPHMLDLLLVLARFSSWVNMQALLFHVSVCLHDSTVISFTELHTWILWVSMIARATSLHLTWSATDPYGSRVRVRNRVSARPPPARSPHSGHLRARRDRIRPLHCSLLHLRASDWCGG